jgi:hypothetical protein
MDRERGEVQAHAAGNTRRCPLLLPLVAPAVTQDAQHSCERDCPVRSLCPIVPCVLDYEVSGRLPTGPYSIRVFSVGRLNPKAIPW